MQFDLDKAYQILEKTPLVLETLLTGLSDDWTMNNEGPDTFSPYDVIGHLIHGEKTDWKARAMMILEHGESTTFVPYDRFAQFAHSKGKSLQQLLAELKELRARNLQWLRSLQLKSADLNKTGMHPDLGRVTLKQLLSTWVAHDLAHIAQVARVMAKQYKEAIGPWVEYLRIMNF